MGSKLLPLPLEPQSLLILHDIRSIINVGALFRTADAVGINQIILSGYTPSPIDRFGRPRQDFIKASLGAEQSVPWTTAESIKKCILDLKKQGYTICCIEQAKNSVDYKSYKPKKGQKLVIIPGNEVTGLSKDILKLADVIVEIPMRGNKESLNVSVATGIVLYRLLDR
jgi:tRNA G18 (ribose-2'-O)-methylase SpoU